MLDRFGQVEHGGAQRGMPAADQYREVAMCAADIEQITSPTRYRRAARHLWRRGEAGLCAHTSLVEPPILARHGRMDIEWCAVLDERLDMFYPVPFDIPLQNVVT